MRSVLTRAIAACVLAGSLATGPLHAAPLPGVFVVSNVPVEHAAAILRALYPKARILTERASNAVIAFASPSEIAQMRAVVQQLDVRKQPAPRAVPADATTFTQIYRLRSVDAASVADLLQRSFPGISVSVEKDLNALTVRAPSAVQSRIAAGIAQLDVGAHATGSRSAPSVAQPGEASAPVDAGNGTSVEVTSLRAAIPASGNAGGTTTAQDVANAVQSALARSAPGLHITVEPNSTQLILTGTPDEIGLAKQLIDQLDVAQKLVVLDTEILEVDETIARNLGLSVQTPQGATVPSISTTISEVVPTPQPNASAPPQFLGLLPFTRTGLSLGLQLNLLVQHGNARILADPRITTISGRTATIRAGDNITVQTQAGGGAGTVATTQLQTFQTGVSLDITPVINAGNYISITLHPVVNNLSGFSNGIPQISTRDTQTTVAMQADQTLIIGGLIEDSSTRTETKIPVLGDIPVVGRIFRNSQFNRQRNELVITVTPHIVAPGTSTTGAFGPPQLTGMPTPQPLPTLIPGTTLPTARPEAARTPVPAGSLPAPQPQAPQTPGAGPRPTPSAFANANVFVYGSPPPNTFAAASDPPKIFYISLSPTVLRSNAQYNVAAITTSNVTSLLLQTPTGTQMLAHTGGAGLWQGTFVFQPGNGVGGGNQIFLQLIAEREDGTTARVNVPVSYAP